MAGQYDVIVAGGGPVGLFLACELGLAGVSVLILERDAMPESPWKVSPLGLRGLNLPSVESMYRRGLLANFFNLEERAKNVQNPQGGHFAGMFLDGSKLDLSRWKYRLRGPALSPGPTTLERIETVLTERAKSLGVTILRGGGISKIIAQDDSSVTVESGDQQTFTAKWLVGCDGGRSLTRKAAGFEFEGTGPTFTGYAVKCDFDRPERLKMGFNVTKNGMYITSPDALRLLDFDNGAFDRTQEITQEHLQEVWDRISKVSDVKITKVHLASAFTDRCKQVTAYRKGRVLVAGDAAHIHSPIGAQGLNAGLGDAMNLGWKLAATLRLESESAFSPVDLSLLDTYESERHPVGAWALEWTRAQVSALRPDLYGVAVHTLVRDLINTTDGANFFIDRFWGLSQRYKLGDDQAHAHPLIGSSVPDFELHDGERLGPKMDHGKGMLIDFNSNFDLRKLIAGKKYERRVVYFKTTAKDQLGLRAVLIRPDGFVAWLVEEGSEPDPLAAVVALERWFGA